MTSTEQKQWFVAEVRTSMERACRQKIVDSGLEAFVASQTERHVYASRNTRTVEHVVIPSKIFVHVLDSQRVGIMQLCSPSIYKFMTNRAAADNKYGLKPYAVIPDEQMQRLMFMLGRAERPVSFVEQPLKVGDRIRVIRGPLTGLEGNYMRDGRASYIVVNLDLLGFTLTEVQHNDVEKI